MWCGCDSSLWPALAHTHASYPPKFRPAKPAARQVKPRQGIAAGGCPHGPPLRRFCRCRRRPRPLVIVHPSPATPTATHPHALISVPFPRITITEGAVSITLCFPRPYARPCLLVPPPRHPQHETFWKKVLAVQSRPPRPRCAAAAAAAVALLTTPPPPRPAPHPSHTHTPAPPSRPPPPRPRPGMVYYAEPDIKSAPEGRVRERESLRGESARGRGECQE